MSFIDIQCSLKKDYRNSSIPMPVNLSVYLYQFDLFLYNIWNLSNKTKGKIVNMKIIKNKNNSLFERNSHIQPWQQHKLFFNREN